MRRLLYIQKEWDADMEKRYLKGLSGSTLKIIAVISMFLDHIGAAVVYRIILDGLYNPVNYENWETLYYVLRGIGRTAFPIFCFLLVEGFLHTRNRGRYARQLFIFALLSELPFDLVFFGKVTMEAQNVYFTLGIGLLVIWTVEKLKEKLAGRSKVLLVIVHVFVLFCGGSVAGLLVTDYDYRGVLLIYIFYLFHFNKVAAGIVGFVSFYWEALCFPAFLLIQCYNGKRGMRLKYLFYLFYPVHLMMIYLFLYLAGWV